MIALLSSFALLERRLLRGYDGVAASSFGPANALTALRILLVPAMVVLLSGGWIVAGSILYAVGALTDVADGIVARRFRCETVFGIMLDPVDPPSPARRPAWFGSEGATSVWSVDRP